MTRARALIAVATAVAIVAGSAERVEAQSTRECIDYSPLGYCVEWDVSAPGSPVQPARSGGDEPTCYWVTLDHDIAAGDGAIFVDYGLERPPDGVQVVWQAWRCSDGTITDAYRWFIPADPGAIASSVRGRIADILPEPAVASSPPLGIAAIVDVPVFVEVTNWTGTVTDGACAGGVCVTVTATPSLTFHPGEPSIPAIACSGTGTRYDPAGATPQVQASASGACAHAYRLRTGTSDRPAAWEGSVVVTWTIAWSASTGASGSLPAVTRAAALPRDVQEVQAVVTGGRTP